MTIQRFNIRVYGLLIWDNQILLVNEKIGNFHFSKFPGGGLEYGEGTKECLIREFKEETGMDVEISNHFYTTDFFQQSAFKETDQLISIYYYVHPLDNPSNIRLDEFEIENKGKTEKLQFFWVKLEELKIEQLNFPIDQLVAKMIQSKKD